MNKLVVNDTFSTSTISEVRFFVKLLDLECDCQKQCRCCLNCGANLFHAYVYWTVHHLDS